MTFLRAALSSAKGMIVLGAVASYLLWQLWLTLAAPGKIAAGFPADRDRVNVVVTLPFTPERFHVLVFQRYGRVSGTQDNSIEVRGVNKKDLASVARPYWVRRVEPLSTGG